MSVAIAALGEGLAAVGAREGPRAHVRPHVIHHVAQFRERLVADVTLQLLVQTPSLLVQVLHFPEAFPFGDPGFVRLSPVATLYLVGLGLAGTLFHNLL